MPIGSILRSLRKERQLSGAELAQQIGVSRSLISQIERGSASPSIDVLRRISGALGVHMGMFFEKEPNNSSLERGPQSETVAAPTNAKPALTHAHKRLKLILPQSSLAHELCTPLSNRQLQVIRSIFQPKEAGPDEPYSHAGQEALYVVAGELTVVVDGAEYILQAGSCLLFDCTLLHSLLNHGDEPAEVLSFITPACY